MLEVCCSTREYVRICGQEVPTEVVKSRLLKLNGEHIGYVIDSLKNNTTKIGNMDNRAREQFGAGPLGQFKERRSIEKLDARFAREEMEDGA